MIVGEDQALAGLLWIRNDDAGPELTRLEAVGVRVGCLDSIWFQVKRIAGRLTRDEAVAVANGRDGHDAGVGFFDGLCDGVFDQSEGRHRLQRFILSGNHRGRIRQHRSEKREKDCESGGLAVAKGHPQLL